MPYTINLPPEIRTVFNASGTAGNNIINLVINIMLFAGVFTAFGFILFGGFKWIISQGDPKSIEGARNTIFYAAIGLGVAFLAILIVNILSFFFKIPLLSTGA